MRKRLSHLHPSFRFSCLNCFGIRSREARITKAPLALLLLPLPTLALDCKSDEGLIKSLVELRNGDFGIPIEEPTSGWDGEEAGTVDESSKEVAMEEPDECEERERERVRKKVRIFMENSSSSCPCMRLTADGPALTGRAANGSRDWALQPGRA